MTYAKREEIDRNLEKFLEILPALMSQHEGKYALIRHGDVDGFYETALDAQIEGNRRFDDQIFSIQCVEETVEELGYFSYAIDSRHS